MMLRALAVFAIAAVQRVASDGVVQLSEAFGGPHGGGFSDEGSIVGGETVSSITIRAGARIDGVSIDISGPTPHTFTHGFDGVSDANSAIHLGPGEFITSMEIHTAKNRHTKQRTRVFYLKFGTNLGNSVSAGSQTDNKNTVTAPPGYQLVGFHGRNDPGRIDQLGAIWSTIPATPAPATPAPEPKPPTAVQTQSSSSSATGSTAAGLDVVIVSESPSTPAPAPPPSGPATQLSEVFGGPHGAEFSDQPLATSAQTVKSIVIRAGSRVDGVALEVTAPTAQRFVHGYDGVSNSNNVLSLAEGEYFTSMEVHWDKNRHTKQHTRIFYLKFGTSTGRFVEGGTRTKYSATASAPEGYQLGGFFGRGEQEIYRLGAVWTSIAAVEDPPAPTDSEAGEDIQLSALYGGPHGVAFSDIKAVKFTQAASSITICAGARIDGITFQVQAPTEQTWSHGYSCAVGSTLTLGSAEYIKSMEVHWGKNRHTKDRTRVFYLEFTTNDGRKVSGGKKAKDYTVVTAPAGFQLAGFYGRAEAGDTLHQIGVIWTRISARDLSLTDPIESSSSGLSYTSTIRNWVGPTIGKSTDTACYRKSVGFGANKVCPLGYSNDGDDCTTECPLAYPVECFLECLPQNDDCALAVMHKIGSVVAVALNAATGGVFGSMYSAYKTVSRTLTCIAGIINVVRGLIFFLRYRQTTAPQGTTAELLTIAYQADVVVFDLPMAVCTCMGLPIPKNALFADTVLVVVEGIVKQAITNGEEIISTADNVLKLLTGAGALNNTPDATVDELQSFISKNSSCGYELKRLTDHVVRAVNDVRNSTPGASANDVRVSVYKSSIVMNDIPSVTNMCMGEVLGSKKLTAAFETRDLLRKTFAVIVDQLIETGTTDMVKNVANNEYMLKVANMGLVALSAIDPTGIAYMASQFVQPICGPTAYLGEIDDGTLHDALGLSTVDEAFTGSYGTWTKKGDGVVRLIFESADNKDVTVVIHSGGDKYAEVDVAAGKTVTWDATIPELQGKSLYLDRWRPGIMGIPGSGGGSLLLWIPRASDGGHLNMHVRINAS